MKNLVVRRIIVLMTLAIISTSVLIVGLGIFISEDTIAYIRTQSYIPDMAVLTELTGHLYDGQVSEETYKSIISAAEDDGINSFSIYDVNGREIYLSEAFPKQINAALKTSLNEVFQGETLYRRLNSHSMEEAERALVGVPIYRNGSVAGAVFVTSEMVDMSTIRSSFLKYLAIAAVIVLIFVILVSNYALRRITKPIRNVVTTALAMVEGDPLAEADETLKGEIGMVGRTLNMLSRELYKNVSQLYIERNRLSHILNSLEEGMIAVDEDMMVTHINGNMVEMTDMEKMFTGPIPVGDLPFADWIEQPLKKVITHQNPFHVKLVDGDFIYRIMIEPIENEGGRVVGAVVLVRDITDLENLELMRKNYVANVSHELRSPLTSIQGLIEPLMDGIVTEPEDTKRYYNIIYRESRRMSRLVNDIMELSRLQTSDVVIETEAVDLNHVLELVYERYRHFDSEIDLVYAAQDLPEIISNGDRIEQILVIFLDNAFKFTPAGGIIEITTEVTEDHVVLGVRDNGPGIDKSHLAHIFDRFYKVDKSRSKKGTGLGLSIAKEIMEIMGGDIACRSTLGEGSAFTISLKS